MTETTGLGFQPLPSAVTAFWMDPDGRLWVWCSDEWLQLVPLCRPEGTP